MTEDKSKGAHKILTIYVADKTYEDLRWLSYKQHISMTQIIRQVLEDYLSKQDLG